MDPRKIAEISRLDLQNLHFPSEARITDAEYLSSYNWIEADTPTIAVPGSPPIWSPPKAPRQLTKDSGFIYIAQNAARHPASPLEPLFRALYAANPTFKISSIDVVTDRNNIRKLLSFVSPDPNGNELETFTIKLEVAKSTLIMCSDEAATHVIIGANDFRGFGHEFEKAYTTSQISNSTGHHRIISYRFCDLSFIIRHETDGYVGANTQMLGPESLSRKLESLSLAAGESAPCTATTASKLRVKEEGRRIALASTLEIKTRTINKPLLFHEVAPQLWVSQTPKLVRAYHNRGRFQEPLVEDVAADVRKWEDDNQTDLRTLGALIKKVLNVVKGCGGQAVVKYDDKGDKLVIWKTDSERMLPDDLYSKWDDANNTQQSLGLRNDPEPTDKTDTERRVEGLRLGPERSKNDQGNHDVPFFDIIQHGTRNGFRQFFRRMPTQLSDYLDLCKSLNVLSIDVLEGRNIRNIMADMRRGKADWDPDEGRKIEGLKSVARDSAFRLLYTFLQGDVKDSNMAYNATLFVVSHRRIFRYKTRKMVREAFVNEFNISQKQQKELDKWPVEECSSAGLQDDDVTTGEEDIYFNSDSSF